MMKKHFVDDVVPVDPSGAIWMESSDLMYGLGGMWNIPAAPAHKAFDDANAALSELKSFVEIHLQNDDLRLWDAMVGNLACGRDELEAAVRDEFSRKAHRIAGVAYPSVQVYPYGSSVETAPKIFYSTGKSLDEVLIHDRIEDLLDGLALLLQCEECLSRIPEPAVQEALSNRVDVVIEGCEALEESLRGKFSRRARRCRKQVAFSN